MYTQESSTESADKPLLCRHLCICMHYVRLEIKKQVKKDMRMRDAWFVCSSVAGYYMCLKLFLKECTVVCDSVQLSMFFWPEYENEC